LHLHLSLPCPPYERKPLISFFVSLDDCEKVGPFPRDGQSPCASDWLCSFSALSGAAFPLHLRLVLSFFGYFHPVLLFMLREPAAALLLAQPRLGSWDPKCYGPFSYCPGYFSPWYARSGFCFFFPRTNSDSVYFRPLLLHRPSTIPFPSHSPWIRMVEDRGLPRLPFVGLKNLIYFLLQPSSFDFRNRRDEFSPLASSPRLYLWFLHRAYLYLAGFFSSQ